ncbi:hypothetical protein TROPICALSUN_70 [Erwinia phage vB_EamM_TropicalSun]|uniref:RepB-like DNA primase domain-containing protein n=2 Tax=Myosmarvirus myosmar TaxID=2846183 RepID=A0A5B9NNW6_9CAUD|nr:DNA primase [Serratia phage MyoSmar]QEG09474.1 DNA primase [Serratia phage MyoSmar]QEG13860.1 hypothetical protein TROPICALSUN_70 [Erwinia phage vB_EamM_TropicalSun]
MNNREWTEQAARFLDELAKGLPEDERLMVGYAEEATVQLDDKGKKVNGGWWPKPHRSGKPIDIYKNCYICISSSIKTPNPKTGELRYWRGETSFGHGVALMVDDIGNGKGSKGDFTLDQFLAIAEPTAVVETSPGNFQLFYFMEEPVADMLYFKAFLNCFVANVLKKGGDNTIKDIARFGRMPCGINNKRGKDNEYKYIVDGKPWKVRLERANYGVRYTPEELAARFGFSIVLPQKRMIPIVEDEYKFDAIWMKLAERILSKAKMGEGAGGDVNMNMSGKFRIRCPWGEEHTNGDPYGAYFRGPIPGAEHSFVFGCGHDSCRKAGRTWAPFVDEIVMPYIEAELEAANRWGATWKI